METRRSDARLEAPLDKDGHTMLVRALARAKIEPPMTALSAHLDSVLHLLVVNLSSGRRLVIPQEDLQYLAHASSEDAAEVTVEMLGRGLHWEKLDLDYSVEGLLEGRRGNAAWMSNLHELRYGSALSAANGETTQTVDT